MFGGKGEAAGFPGPQLLPWSVVVAGGKGPGVAWEVRFSGCRHGGSTPKKKQSWAWAYISSSYGDGSKPCTPGEHQNSW